MAQIIHAILIGILLTAGSGCLASQIDEKAGSTTVYVSDQIRSPVMTSMLSAVTLGFWPARFGDDLRPADSRADGWSAMQAEALYPHAHETFQKARLIWWAVGFVLIFGKRLRKSVGKIRFSVIRS